MCAKTVKLFDTSYLILYISIILVLCQIELSEGIVNVFYDENKNVRFIGFFFK